MGASHADDMTMISSQGKLFTGDARETSQRREYSIAASGTFGQWGPFCISGWQTVSGVFESEPYNLVEVRYRTGP